MKRRLHLPKIQNKERFSLTLFFGGMVFLFFVGIMVLTAAVLFVCTWLGWIDRDVTGLPITFLISLMIMVVGFGADLQQAHDKALAAVESIECDNLFYRRDIGWRVL